MTDREFSPATRSPSLADRFDETVGRAVAAWRRSPGGSPSGSEPAPSAAELLPTDVTTKERRLLGSVETSLRRGSDLLSWWRDVYPRNAFADRFPLAQAFNSEDSSFGFFDVAPVEGAPLPIMGNYQEMLYDRRRSEGREGSGTTLPDLRDQLQDFVLRYFMRVSDFRLPEVAESQRSQQPPALLRPLSICPQEGGDQRGFGFTQLFYKEKDTGRIGRFSKDEQHAIVDLREIGRRYAWILVKVNIFNFSFEYRPFGSGGPSFSLPLTEDSYLVVSPEYVEDSVDGAAGDLGSFAIGYSFVRNPKEGLLAFGPGEFEAAVEIIRFRLDTEGRTRVEMIFVCNRPERIVNLSLDPVAWATRFADFFSFGQASRMMSPLTRAADALPRPRQSVDPIFAGLELLNHLTLGFSGRELCLERSSLEFEFLVKHFMQHYQTVAGSLHTWRQIPDWTDEASLPHWIVRGCSS